MVVKGAVGKRLVDYAEVFALFQELQNGWRVAERMGIAPSTVSRVLRNHFGVVRGKTGRPPTLDVPRDETIRRYLAGEPCRTIAQTFGVDSEVVRMRLRRWGVERRIGGVSGSKHPSWKGGLAEKRERAPDMHYYRRQSYEVAAICLGQPLAQGMVIHHADENWRNNNPSNLILFESQGFHASFHQRLDRLRREGNVVNATQLALENGGRALPQPPSPIQLPLGTDRRSPSGTQRSLSSTPIASELALT